MLHRFTLIAGAACLLAAQGAYAAQDLVRRAAVAADVSVEVSNVSGLVEVTAWDRNEVELKAWLESDEDRLEWEATDRHVKIKVTKPKDARKGPKEAKLWLKVPAGTRLHAQTVSADLTVAGVRGEQRLDSVSGDARTEAYDERVVLRNVSGDTVVTGSGGKAAVSVSSVSGNATARALRGDFEGNAVSGDFEVELAAAGHVRLKSVSGNLKGTLPLAANSRVDAESLSGDVRLRFASPVNAEFDVETFSGSIGGCFGPKAEARSKYGPGRETRFTQGDGGARVRIKTMSGNVEYCDR